MDRTSILVERKMLPDIINPYGYIYITTNLVNNKLYIGKHSRPKFDKSYFGSGKGILNAIKKYGKSNFICEVIDWAKDEYDLNCKEIYWISFLGANTHSKYFYNQSGGGQGWTSEDVSGDKNPMYGVHRTGWKHTKETRKQQSESGYKYWNSLSDEEKHKRQLLVNRKRYDSLSEEKKKLQLEQLAKARLKLRKGRI